MLSRTSIRSQGSSVHAALVIRLRPGLEYDCGDSGRGGKGGAPAFGGIVDRLHVEKCRQAVNDALRDPAQHHPDPLVELRALAFTCQDLHVLVAAAIAADPALPLHERIVVVDTPSGRVQVHVAYRGWPTAQVVSAERIAERVASLSPLAASVLADTAYLACEREQSLARRVVYLEWVLSSGQCGLPEPATSPD